MDTENLQRRRRTNATPHNAAVTEKRLKRGEILAKKKADKQLIKEAYAKKDHLASFPAFRHFQINGLSVCLKSGHGNALSSPVKRYIQNLLKLNMEGPYGSEWQVEEKVKRVEMVDPEACYIFVHEVDNSNADEMTTVLTTEDTSTSRLEDSSPLVGFVHYRFVLEEENCMGAVMLTVQKANLSAMKFYTNISYQPHHLLKLFQRWRQVMKFYAKHLMMKLKLF
ncbi:uncharacterized protein LOC127133682 isoform X4 [Lathyrus oleraceus]|uniref:uncharacterized protein LOC127133682 isoform X4 n=1 Tax=Pisum sativum TaxID=3888 RepID=UPI0021D298A3|nr:uncharacterized protein LOC127133682 isoform X4 [Pisum sativum]